jgi:hypothetical protein
MSKTIQLNSCPNPKCEKKFENLILVHDYSKKPPDIYYGCPYCLMKLDPIATQILKKEEISTEKTVDKKTEIASPQPEKEIPQGCPQYFGYLYVRPKDDIIPQECLVCQKILDCTLQNENFDKSLLGIKD